MRASCDDASGRSRRAPFWLALGVAIVGALVAVASVAFSWEVNTDGPRRREALIGALACVPTTAMSAWLVRRLPRHPVPWLVAIITVTALGDSALIDYAYVAQRHGWPAVGAAAWANTSLFALGLPLVPLLVLLFPDGRPASPRFSWPVRLAVAAPVVIFVSAALSDGPVYGETIDNPIGVPGSRAVLGLVLIAASVVLLAICTPAGVLSLRARWGAGRIEERQQIAWVLTASVTAAVLLAAALATQAVLGRRGIAEALFEITYFVVLAGIPLAIAIAVLRHRLYDLDLVINRALVSIVVSGILFAIYVSVVDVVTVAVGEQRIGLGPGAAGAALVAMGFAPIRALVQRRIDRLMYGERDNPYRAIKLLRERLSPAMDPSALSRTIAEGLQQTLKVPHVAVELAMPDGSVSTELAGRPRMAGWPAITVALEHGDTYVGRIVVAQRDLNTAFTAADLRLLEDLAHHAGVSAYAARATLDLERSRDRLVAAREDERQRLRRDLHDGLGPSLSGMRMALEAARVGLTKDPDAAERLLRRIDDETASAASVLRRVVEDLRPAELDDVGLVGALRRRASTFTHPGALAVTVESSSLPPLDAATELATYRIVVEGITNAARHSGGRRIDVRIGVNDALVMIEIEDDGSGGAIAAAAGVGIESMRARAADLGGCCEFRPSRTGGTLVVARLPLRAGSH